MDAWDLVSKVKKTLCYHALKEWNLHFGECHNYTSALQKCWKIKLRKKFPEVEQSGRLVNGKKDKSRHDMVAHSSHPTLGRLKTEGL